MDVLDKISEYLGEEVKKYQKRRVAHGRKRSAAGRMKGTQKRSYIKNLKKRKKEYARNASMRRKAKVARKKYLRTSKAKQTARRYKPQKGLR